MSEVDLELLITLDDPDGGPEEDIFNHLQARNNLTYWLEQQFSRVGLNERVEATDTR
jgi:hypothetical protein